MEENNENDFLVEKIPLFCFIPDSKKSFYLDEHNGIVLEFTFKIKNYFYEHR